MNRFLIELGILPHKYKIENLKIKKNIPGKKITSVEVLVRVDNDN